MDYLLGVDESKASSGGLPALVELSVRRFEDRLRRGRLREAISAFALFKPLCLERGESVLSKAFDAQTSPSGQKHAINATIHPFAVLKNGN